MALFRRAPRGKHALGAAVTSIPSGPPPAPQLPPPPASAAPFLLAPQEAPAPAEADVMTSISALLATGEAWADEVEPRQAPPAAPAPATPAPRIVQAPDLDAPQPVSAAPLPVATSATTAVAPAVPHVPVAAPPAPAVAPPAPAAPARSSLDAAVSALLKPARPDAATSAAPAAAVPVQAAPPRVQLGFRDGTSATLDPLSSSAMALEQLAQSLARRD